MHWIALLPPHEDEALSWGWHGLRFTPRVARLEEAWVLEVEASERLFGGRDALLAQLLALSPVIPADSPVIPADSSVIPAQAGIQTPAEQGDGPCRSHGTSLLDSRLRGNDEYLLRGNDEYLLLGNDEYLLRGHDEFPVWAQGPTCLVALALLRLKVQGGPTPARVPHDLPLPLLSAAAPHAPLLERTGCRTWGQLRALPRGPVARRFGPGLLQALDIAWGERPARHAWLQLPEVFDQRLELPALATSGLELMAVAQRLLTQLQLWLRARHLGVLALELEWTLDLKRHNGVPLPSHEQLVLRTAEPAQETAHLRRLLGEQLARVRLAAPANHLRLRTLQTCPWQAQSRSFLPEDNISGDRLHQLIERLSARLGEDKVLVPLSQADWRPERMQCWEAAVRSDGRPRDGSRLDPRLRGDDARSLGDDARSLGDDARSLGDDARSLGDDARSLGDDGRSLGDDGRSLGDDKGLVIPAKAGIQNPADPREGGGMARHVGDASSLYPPWLLPQPQPLEVRGHQPWYEGPLRLLTRRQRIETGWWEPGGAVVRDYCIARSEHAGLLWIFREHSPDGQARWYLQGFYA